jgi:uncharacterized protein YndB with AHSA1/START domain
VKVSRSRTLDAPPEAVWAVLADPHRLPAWWPRVERVEGVTGDEWTTVLRSERGKAVRADYRVSEAETEAPRRRAWAQQLEGTPFERLLWESVTVATLEPAGDGTRASLEVRQRPRGWARLGAFLLRRAARRQLDEALAALAELVER